MSMKEQEPSKFFNMHDIYNSPVTLRDHDRENVVVRRSKESLQPHTCHFHTKLSAYFSAIEVPPEVV